MTVAASRSMPDGSPRIRFSLGDLFRGLTVCAVGLFAAVQFDPLMAIRAVACGLAIGVAVLAWRQRSKRLWLAAGATALTGLLPTILAANAPFSHRDAVCLECGRHRITHEVCGWTTRDDIEETEISRWAEPLVAVDHRHGWVTTSVHQRSHWFGIAPIGCGGPGEGAFMAWQFARLGDQATGEQVYREYCDIQYRRSAKPMMQHRQETAAALEVVMQAKQP